jgi:hypothetical protein
MISYQECLDFSDLTEEEVAAIAEHEHIPDAAALELGAYLLGKADGISTIAGMIRDDLNAARAHGDVARVVRLRRALAHLLARHPERPARA